MKLYHGSNQVVGAPQLLTSSRTLDFGAGFYTTTNHDQAVEFSRKVVDRMEGVGKPTVSVYEFNDHMLDLVLAVRRFNGPTDDWLDFVVDNRRKRYVGPNYDLKIGPVANDNVYRVLQLYMTGVLTREQTIGALKVHKLFDQYVFSTEKALKMLRFVKSEVYT